MVFDIFFSFSKKRKVFFRAASTPRRIIGISSRDTLYIVLQQQETKSDHFVRLIPSSLLFISNNIRQVVWVRLHHLLVCCHNNYHKLFIAKVRFVASRRRSSVSFICRLQWPLVTRVIRDWRCMTSTTCKNV